MDPEREDTARWLDEDGELLSMLHDEVDHLTQENERLRAELGRLDELQAVIARVNRDADRLRAERDELLAGAGPGGRARKRLLPDSIAVATPASDGGDMCAS
jgi:type II secretory pathway component PulJ